MSCTRSPTAPAGADPTVIPIAAKLGDNVVNRSENTPWQ